MSNAKKILVVTDDKKLKEVLEFCFAGWGYETEFVESIGGDLSAIKKSFPDSIIIDAQSGDKEYLDACRLLKEDFVTAFIPVITLINKRHLRGELLHLKQGVDDYLIKPPDPLDLKVRIEMAIRRSQCNFYANPLTGLPSGRIIEDAIRSRLDGPDPFTFGYLDIDNFKYFNDVYGYVKGDRAIMQSAYMLHAVVRQKGNRDDFVGHIGGDDFVFITTPDKYAAICDGYMDSFTTMMQFHYTAADRQRGFIVAHDRSRKEKQVPLMSISMAVVTRDEKSKLANIIEMNERLTEIKKFLKNIPGSKYMEERRDVKKDKKAPPIAPHLYVARHSDPSYRPLGQRLLDEKALTPDQLDEALAIHWRRGIACGEILKELGFVKEEIINQALSQKTSAPQPVEGGVL